LDPSLVCDAAFAAKVGLAPNSLAVARFGFPVQRERTGDINSPTFRIPSMETLLILSYFIALLSGGLLGVLIYKKFFPHSTLRADIVKSLQVSKLFGNFIFAAKHPLLVLLLATLGPAVVVIWAYLIGTFH
jgi:hypothetical protein